MIADSSLTIMLRQIRTGRVICELPGSSDRGRTGEDAGREARSVDYFSVSGDVARATGSSASAGVEADVGGRITFPERVVDLDRRGACPGMSDTHPTTTRKDSLVARPPIPSQTHADSLNESDSERPAAALKPPTSWKPGDEAPSCAQPIPT